MKPFQAAQSGASGALPYRTTGSIVTPDLGIRTLHFDEGTLIELARYDSRG